MSPRSALAATLTLALAATGVVTVAGRASSAPADHAGRAIATGERADGAVDLRYRSLGVGDELVEQTAVLWEPTGTPSGHVVAWAHHTTGLADRCAPSTEHRPQVPGLAALLAAGHVVVAPDYEGLGAEGEHPYLVGVSAGRSVLDAILAARQVTGADGRSAVFGWSQGGHAALFAARLAGTYAPEARLAGVAAIAPVTDMAELVDSRSVFSRLPGFVAMVAAGYEAAYPELDPRQVVPDAGRAVAVARRSCSLEAVAALADTPTAVPGPEWQARLHDNDPTTVAIDVPVLLVHGERDELLALDDAVDAYRSLCGHGTDIRLERLAEGGHGTTPFLAADDVVDWLDHRLDGADLTGCAMRRW